MSNNELWMLCEIADCIVIELKHTLTKCQKGLNKQLISDITWTIEFAYKLYVTSLPLHENEYKVQIRKNF